MANESLCLTGKASAQPCDRWLQIFGSAVSCDSANRNYRETYIRTGGPTEGIDVAETVANVIASEGAQLESL